MTDTSTPILLLFNFYFDGISDMQKICENRTDINLLSFLFPSLSTVFPLNLRASCRHDASLSQILQCVFTKNEDIPLHNHSAMIKPRQLTLRH